MGDAAPKSHLSQLSGHWQKQEINKTNWEEREGKCDWLRWGFRLPGCTQLITSSGSPHTFPLPPPHHYPPFIHLYGVLVLPFALTLSSLRPFLLLPLSYHQTHIFLSVSVSQFVFLSSKAHTNYYFSSVLYSSLAVWAMVTHPASCFTLQRGGMKCQSSIIFWGFLHSLPENVDATFFPPLKNIVFLDYESSISIKNADFISNSRLNLQVLPSVVLCSISLMFKWKSFSWSPWKEAQSFSTAPVMTVAWTAPHERWKSTLFRHCWIMGRPWQWQYLRASLYRWCWIDICISW